jgi:hypothetical protein
MNTGTAHVDPDELAAALDETGAAGSYTHTFKSPFAYMGKEYAELRFDWDSLTGNDALNIEAEMAALGKPVVVPAFSGDYLIRMAAKACAVQIGADAFGLMKLSDYNRIRTAARSFLLTSE